MWSLQQSSRASEFKRDQDYLNKSLYLTSIDALTTNYLDKFDENSRALMVTRFKKYSLPWYECLVACFHHADHHNRVCTEMRNEAGWSDLDYSDSRKKLRLKSFCFHHLLSDLIETFFIVTMKAHFLVQTWTCRRGLW